MVRNQFIDCDLEAHPLQIKTDSEKGSNDYLTLVAYNRNATGTPRFQYDGIGHIGIKFSDPIKYLLKWCSSMAFVYKNFTTPLLEEQHKVWTISKTSTNLNITCNGIGVLDFNFETALGGRCVSKWSQDVAKIVFWDRGSYDDDTASNEYKVFGK